VLEVAVEAGARTDNPAEKLEPAEIRHKEKTVPSFAQMARLFAALKRRRGHAHFMARFLYYFSLRVDTAVHLTPAMVNRKAHVFEIPGELVKRGRAGEVVTVPIFPQMAELLAELDAKLGKRRKRVLPVTTIFKTLRLVCADLKLPAMNHHSFRHAFTTHAILKGIDVRTLAKWRNDKDGGAMLLRVYSHLIDGESRAKAAQLRFGEAGDFKIVPMRPAAG
jgi:integrase